MVFENTQIVTYNLINIFAITTVVLSFLVLKNISQKKEYGDIKKTIFFVFTLLGIGYLFYTVAELIWSLLSFMGYDPSVGIADYFWIIGMFLVFGGFLYFAIYSYKQDAAPGKKLTFLLISCFSVFVLLYYLISNFILGAQEGESQFEIFLDLFYPIGSALILITSLSVYSFYKNLQNFGKPLLYLAIASLCSFIGDMFYTYYSWNDIYGLWGVFSDSLYCLEYMMASLAFFTLYTIIKKSKKSSSIKTILFGAL